MAALLAAPELWIGLGSLLIGMFFLMQGSAERKKRDARLARVTQRAPRTQTSEALALRKRDPNRVIATPMKKMSDMKLQSYAGDSLMAVTLSTVTGLVLVFSALGIFGLATFNVNTRTRQIGTRRAVGARKRDIVRYFMTENWIITTLGVVVGCCLALAAGFWLSTQFQLPRLDLYYLIGGVLGLWLVGQLAAWQPSRKAAKVSPAMATRTV